ncbi:MAG: LEA type 2 family protein [Pseudomonadota bacterium]
MQYLEVRESLHKSCQTAVLLAVSLALGACATVDTMIESPRVSLSQVELSSFDLDGQTVLLGFDVTNPNPFPLPVSALRYGVELDGHRFASGETEARFTVPAQSDLGVAISVDLDLLRTAPRLIQIMRSGAHRDIPYSLKGEFDVDVPLSPSVAFAGGGTIRLFADR